MTKTVLIFASGLRLWELAKMLRYQAIWLETDSVWAPNCCPVGSAIKQSWNVTSVTGLTCQSSLTASMLFQGPNSNDE